MSKSLATNKLKVYNVSVKRNSTYYQLILNLKIYEQIASKSLAINKLKVYNVSVKRKRYYI